MSPLLVITKIRQAGGMIWSEDQDLRIEAPVGLLTPEDRTVLAEYKTDLIPLLSRPIPVDDPVEREAIVWADTAPAAALDQALAEWDEIVEADLPPVEDLDQWLRENTIEPVVCDCGGLERWQDLAGGWHCTLCRPPMRSEMLRLQVRQILRRNTK